MYFQPSLVAQLFCAISAQFPGAAMLSATVPSWFSRLTVNGLQQTPHYRLPPMPWGIGRDQITEILKSWNPGLAEIEFPNCRAARGRYLDVIEMINLMPVFRHQVACRLKTRL